MSHAITPYFVSHDLPGFTAMIPQQPPEETLGSRTVPLGLKIDIYHLAILVNHPPQATPRWLRLNL